MFCRASLADTLEPQLPQESFDSSSSANVGGDALESDDSHEKPLKKRRPNFMEITTAMFQFPAKLVKALNNGGDHEIDAVVEEFITPQCTLSTKAAPKSLVGHESIKNFYKGLLMSNPDMVMRLLGVRVHSDKTIICHGVFDGTRIDGYHRYKDPTDLAGAKDNWTFVDLVKEGRQSAPQSSKSNAWLTEEEKQLLQLEKKAKSNQVMVRSVSKFICSLECINVKAPAAKGAPPSQRINRMLFDWKVLSMQESEI
jgi:hypothetical protein